MVKTTLPSIRGGRRPVRTAGAAIALALGVAGCGPTPVQLDDPTAGPAHALMLPQFVQIGARVAADSEGFTVFLSLFNPTPRNHTLETGVCAFRVRGYGDAGLTEPAFWTDQYAHSTVCVDILVVHPIPPGESEVEMGSRRFEDLEMGVPARPGWWGVVVERDEELFVLPGGRIE